MLLFVHSSILDLSTGSCFSCVEMHNASLRLCTKKGDRKGIPEEGYRNLSTNLTVYPQKRQPCVYQHLLWLGVYFSPKLCTVCFGALYAKKAQLYKQFSSQLKTDGKNCPQSKNATLSRSYSQHVDKKVAYHGQIGCGNVCLDRLSTGLGITL